MDRVICQAVVTAHNLFYAEGTWEQISTRRDYLVYFTIRNTITNVLVKLGHREITEDDIIYDVIKHIVVAMTNREEWGGNYNGYRWQLKSIDNQRMC